VFRVPSWSVLFARSWCLPFLGTCLGLGLFFGTCLGLVCVAAEMVVSASSLRISSFFVRCGLFFRASSLCSVCHLGQVFCSLVLGFVFLRDMLRSRAFFEPCLGLGFAFLLCFVLPCVILVFREPSWSGFCSFVLGDCLFLRDMLRSRVGRLETNL
jgi:hypothetical protein